MIALRGGNDDVQAMPPKKEEQPTKDELALLEKWIDGGARHPADDGKTASAGKHWSFQPIVRVAPPEVKNIHWVRNPIDRFILARLEKEGLKPSPEADRVTLIRRLSLDLLGLPPTPSEVDAFVNDKRPDAYERLVDRLAGLAALWRTLGPPLARPGPLRRLQRLLASMPPAPIWKYRDWVIDALNRDKPFDQFTIEQLAGDLLPGATLDQKIATGFHRNTQINEEGGIDIEQFRVESVVDRVNTTGSVWLGLTVGCCQCHDHKFDPLSQREYYQLFAFFNNRR